MFTFVVRRVLQNVPLLFLISVLLFIIVNNAPGGPLGPYLQNPHITAADIARLKHNLGLDQPMYVQYLHWLQKVFQGDFGYSTSNSEPVTQAILERMPATFLLLGVSFIISLILGVGAGIYAALKPYTTGDYLVTTMAFFGQSMPVFWFALMMQLVFAVHGIPLPFGYEITLPSAGIATNSDQIILSDRIVHLIMPVVVLSLLQLATYSRFMRSSMLEVCNAEYMRTAAAKGLGYWTVVWKHGLKNALIPMATIVTLSLPGLFGGAIVTETIFAWPGMGRLFYNALTQSDIALLMAYLCINAVLVLFFNTLADVVYGWLDPRVKYD